MKFIKVFLQSQTSKDFARKCIIGAEKLVTMLLAFVGYVILFFFSNCTNKLFGYTISFENSSTYVLLKMEKFWLTCYNITRSFSE